MEYGVMFFGAGGAEGVADRYKNVLAVAKEVDGSRIGAIWTPERHYHPFGGIFPQPAVLSAALAVTTSRLRIRAGSVVAPLHQPAQIVEQWAVVDALSDGRVDLALATGWNSVDFWTKPEAFADRYAIIEQSYRQIRELWNGQHFDVTAPDGLGRRIRVYPSPVQANLSVSLAASGSRETFLTAGRLGAGVLTHMLGQSADQLAANISAYRESFKPNADDPSGPWVTLMLHTHLGHDRERALAAGTSALVDYLMVSIDLDLTNRPGAEVEMARQRELAQIRAGNLAEHSALFGDLEDATERLASLQSIGVDEIAFLIDFGIDDKALVAQARLLAEWCPELDASLSPDAT